MTQGGRVALVTGAGSGIGRCTALRLAADGAHVVVLDLDEGAAADAVEQIKSAGGNGLALQVDVADAQSVEQAFTAAASDIANFDILVNNAGIFSGGSVATVADADWERSFAVNVRSVFLCSRAFLRAVDGERGGAIVNIASVAGLVAVENAAAYCAAKGAVVALTRSMALDLAPQRVRVNAVCPGTVYTPMMEPLIARRGGGDYDRGMAMTVAKYPIGRLGTPEEIAEVIAFLAGPASSFMTGSIVAADGGMTSC